MDSEIRSKVWNDLLVNPVVLGPVVIGGTLMMASWPLASLAVTGVGLISVVTGVGAFFTRYCFKLDQITKNAQDYVLQKQVDEEQKRLDHLDARLKADRDPRPETCLRQLRDLRERLLERKDNALWHEVLEEFDSLFDVCVKHIEQTDQMWRRAKAARNSDTKRQIQAEREKLVLDIEQAAGNLTILVNQFCSDCAEKVDDTDLSLKTKELEQAMLVAKRTEERLSGTKNYSEKDFQ